MPGFSPVTEVSSMNLELPEAQLGTKFSCNRELVNPKRV